MSARRQQWGAPQDSRHDCQDPPRRMLSVTVLFTTVPETLNALQQAAELAFDLEARIRILILQVVPYPLPIDQPPVHPDFRLRQFRTLWKEKRIHTRVDIWLCRDARQCLQNALAPNSLVVIGKRRAWWPFTRARRLERDLYKAGHQVICAGSSQIR